MDQTPELDKDLVQLARLALTGRSQDVQTYVVRLRRKYQATAPELSERLGHLIKESPTRNSPLRNESVSVIPVDKDSRLQLLRHEAPVELDHEPIWTPDVRIKLDQILAEHSRAATLFDQGLSPTRTVLFTGPPGVGKTLAARWLARQLDRPLLTLDLSAVMSSFLGRTGENVRHVLDFAKGVPCVLLLDELDAMAKRRDDVHEVGELKRLVTVLLQEIDDWPQGGLLVAATNHKDLLDPAVWRRFEEQIEFPLPTPQEVQRAVHVFLSSGRDLAQTWKDALSTLFIGKSFNDIERELMSVRRQAIVHGAPLTDILSNVFRKHMAMQDKSTKKDIAVRLAEAGLSQRQINDLTGLSRDTLRKMGGNATDAR